MLPLHCVTLLQCTCFPVSPVCLAVSLFSLSFYWVFFCWSLSASPVHFFFLWSHSLLLTTALEHHCGHVDFVSSLLWYQLSQLYLVCECSWKEPVAVPFVYSDFVLPFDFCSLMLRMFSSSYLHCT